MQHVQQTVPVQVPVTASNGQTVYQTVHFPVQALSSVFNVPATQMIPQITQVCNKLLRQLVLTVTAFYIYRLKCNSFTANPPSSSNNHTKRPDSTGPDRELTTVAEFAGEYKVKELIVV